MLKRAEGACSQRTCIHRAGGVGDVRAGLLVYYTYVSSQAFKHERQRYDCDLRQPSRANGRAVRGRGVGVGESRAA